jgi:hypothetical protein
MRVEDEKEKVWRDAGMTASCTSIGRAKALMERG